jgi:hypothetical protein
LWEGFVAWLRFLDDVALSLDGGFTPRQLLFELNLLMQQLPISTF